MDANARILLICFLLAAFHQFVYGSCPIYIVKEVGPERQCVECPPGTFVGKDCLVGDWTSTVCQPCPPNRFSDVCNAFRKCKPCKKRCFGVAEILVSRCTNVTDTVCGCRDGYWHEKHGTSDAKCLLHKKCGKGFGVNRPGTKLIDSTCVNCVQGSTFSAVVSSSEPCQPCRDCKKGGLNETLACTVIQNAECEEKPTQAPSESPHITANTTNSNPTNGEDPSLFVVVGIPIIVGIIGIIAIAVGVLVCRFCRRCPGKQKDRESHSKLEQDTGFNISQRSSSPHNIRRRISNLTLKEGVTLENDVFIWMSDNLGDSYEKICMLLPGEYRITRADIQEANFQYRDLPGVTRMVLETWRHKNGSDDNNMFTVIYRTLWDENRVLAEELKTKFSAQNI